MQSRTIIALTATALLSSPLSVRADESPMSSPQNDYVKQHYNSTKVQGPDGKDVFQTLDVDRFNGTQTKPIEEADVVLTQNGTTTSYHVVYNSYAHFHVWESGNCGAFECDLTCSDAASGAYFDRSLYLKGSGTLVAHKVWAGTGDTGESFGKSCNEYMQANFPGFTQRILGTLETWKGLIDQDTRDIQNGHP